MTLIIKPEDKDLGEFTVRRVLPAAEKKAVGPFVFFDHFGPAEFPPGKGIQVRPHPHIGLATVSYLFEGQIMHRDSLGCVQPIHPGEVNLMTAGRGIVHSERAGDDIDRTSRLHGIQIWIALPEDQQECEPDFAHYPEESLPRFEQDGVPITLVMGSAFGRTSPVRTYSETVYLDCEMPAGGSLELPNNWQELGIYVVSGELGTADQKISAHSMAVIDSGGALRLSAEADCRFVICGGDPLGRRIVWWNLVSTSRELIEKAKRDWAEGRFDPVPGDPEFIPLPEE